jgi:hypothetical protein
LNEKSKLNSLTALYPIAKELIKRAPQAKQLDRKESQKE